MHFRNYVEKYLTYKPGGGHPHLKPICDWAESMFAEARDSVNESITNKSFEGVGDAIQGLATHFSYLFHEQHSLHSETIVRMLNSWRMAANRCIIGDHYRRADWAMLCENLSLAAQLECVTALVQFPDQEGLKARWEAIK